MKPDVMKPDVSIIIPAYNAAATLTAQLDAVLEQAPLTAEILVVDNQSRDDTATIVEKIAARDSRVRLVRADGGRGPSYTRNVGARAARAELLLFCDADDLVARGWVAALLAALETAEFAGGPLEVDELNPSWLADGRGRWGVDQPGMFGNVAFGHGCNLALRRTTYLDAGGLDEHLHAGEEIDLSLRLQRRAIPFTFVPAAVVHYRYRSELRALARQAYAYGRVVPTLNRRGQGLAGFAPERVGPRRLLWLVKHLLGLRDPATRVRWVWFAANSAGRVAGTIRPPRVARSQETR